jgi:penicillin amidase/acyl-homoserine-lactone acylase
MFFVMDRYARALLDENYDPEIAEKQEVAGLQQNEDGLKYAENVDFSGPGFLTGNREIGSNTFAIAPSRTPDGSTHLNINSHQPFTGPVAWYEARLHSEEGWDIVGGVFPGTPVILHGHNRDLGWAHTVNRPDLVDIYALELNPENENQYKYDGKWLDFDRDEVTLRVRMWGGIKIPVTREVLHTVHGPAMRTPGGKVYALKYGGYGDITQVEQWYRMNKATNIDEFEDALRIQGIASFNIGYADKEGNIWYVYNAKYPKRAEGWDWSKVLPGNTSETNWTEYLPFDALPQIRNPESGYVYNCNGTPFRSTAVDENLDPANFSPTMGMDDPDTNRELRAFELLDADDSISYDEFYAIKYDTKYSTNSPAYRYRETLPDMVDTDDPIVKEALDVLMQWDLDTNLENTSTAIGVMTMEPIVRAEIFGNPIPEIAEVFKEKAHVLHKAFGKIDVPWGEVNRIVRGNVNLPLEGGPDTLRAVYGDWDPEENHLEAQAGDCYVLLVSWDKDGNQHSESIHQFGSATMDEDSPHFGDQVPLFAKEEMKPTLMDAADLEPHITRTYSPGEEVE